MFDIESGNIMHLTHEIICFINLNVACNNVYVRRKILYVKLVCDIVYCRLAHRMQYGVSASILSRTVIGVAKHPLIANDPGHVHGHIGQYCYSAALVPLGDSELGKLYLLHMTWLQVYRTAWRLTPGIPSAPTVFNMLPGEQACLSALRNVFRRSSA